jgi:hypothetical protein
MKNAEAITTDNGAAVAEQGATVAPEKAPSKKGEPFGLAGTRPGATSTGRASRPSAAGSERLS